jgi:hypothetical protein
MLVSKEFPQVMHIYTPVLLTPSSGKILIPESNELDEYTERDEKVELSEVVEAIDSTDCSENSEPMDKSIDLSLLSSCASLLSR